MVQLGIIVVLKAINNHSASHLQCLCVLSNIGAILFFISTIVRTIVRGMRFRHRIRFPLAVYRGSTLHHLFLVFMFEFYTKMCIRIFERAVKGDNPSLCDEVDFHRQFCCLRLLDLGFFTDLVFPVGAGDADHPNRVRVTVTIPHRDGMLPIVSTRQLSNFELTLSPDAFRIGLHQCSNLLDYTEVTTKYGFLTNATKNPNVLREVVPYQYSGDLRSLKTLRFYR